MDVREKLVELIAQKVCDTWSESCDEWMPQDCGKCYANDCHISELADHLISNGVTAQEYGEWVHPKEYVVSNDFLCSNCGHREVSYYPINPRLGGGRIADENGNFFYPPKLNYCPNCGAKIMPQPPKGE